MAHRFQQLTHFALVGLVGFFVDAGVLLVVSRWLGPYGGRVLSFAAAVLATWLLNRSLTFRHQRSGKPVHHELAHYALTTLGGGAVNFGCYYLLVYLLGLPALLLPMAVAAGSLAGMTVNFWLSRTFVFSANAQEM